MKQPSKTILEINRDLLYITPKQPCIDWANSKYPYFVQIGEGDPRLDMAEVLLIPEVENSEKAMEWLRQNWEFWFEYFLSGWCQNEEDWPVNRSWQLMNEFFNIKYQSVINDTMTTALRKKKNSLE